VLFEEVGLGFRVEGLGCRVWACVGEGHSKPKILNLNTTQAQTLHPKPLCGGGA
jgi:hypothetical protein